MPSRCTARRAGSARMRRSRRSRGDRRDPAELGAPGRRTRGPRSRPRRAEHGEPGRGTGPAAQGREGMGTRAGDPASGSRLFREGDEVKTPPQALRAGDTPCWDFVSAHAEVFGVQRICRVLQVSRSGYYRWLAGAKARRERQAADDALLVEIREIHTEHKG